MTDTKTCTKCGETKGLKKFCKDNSRKDGCSVWCKSCKKKSNRKRYAVNPEKERDRVRKWKIANPEKVKEAQRKWYSINSEKAYQQSQEWIKANPEKRKEYNKRWAIINPEKKKKAVQKWREANQKRHKANLQKWQKANSEKCAGYSRNRKAREKNAVGTHTAEDISKIFFQQGGLCNACGKKLIRYNKKQYHVDHIIPISRGGGNGPDNLQLLCPFCNISKKDKNPVKWARENGRLF